jgi:WD40 repeat protein
MTKVIAVVVAFTALISVARPVFAMSIEMITLAGASPVPFHAVATDAPVLVSTGRASPIRLGDQLPYDPSGTLHVWNWNKASESRPLKITCKTGMAVSPDGKAILTREGQLIDAASGAVKRLDHFNGEVHGMRFSPDGRTLLLTIDKAKDTATARVLDFPSAKMRFEVEGQWSYTFACAFTPDGSQFFLMDKDRFIHRWDARTGEDLGRYEPALDNSIRAIAVSPDARRLVAAGTRGEIYLWDLAGGKMLHKLVADAEPDLTVLTGIDSLAFSPDGKRIAGGGLSRLIFWETASGKVVRLLPRASHGAVQIRFSRDGKTITTVHDFYGTRKKGADVLVYPTVRAWDVETGKEQKVRR